MAVIQWSSWCFPRWFGRWRWSHRSEMHILSQVNSTSELAAGDKSYFLSVTPSVSVSPAHKLNLDDTFGYKYFSQIQGVLDLADSMFVIWWCGHHHETACNCACQTGWELVRTPSSVGGICQEYFLSVCLSVSFIILLANYATCSFGNILSSVTANSSSRTVYCALRLHARCAS